MQSTGLEPERAQCSLDPQSNALDIICQMNSAALCKSFISLPVNFWEIAHLNFERISGIIKKQRVAFQLRKSGWKHTFIFLL